MIVKNPIERSALVIYTFWYVSLYIFFSTTASIAPWWVAMDFPLSFAVIGIGALIGVGATFGVTALRTHRREVIVKAGRHDAQANVTLGDFMGFVPTERGGRDTLAPMLARLHGMKWWKHVSERFPQHAAAIEAVTSVMANEPLLPASPIPGGHAGRTLFEHSLAVASQILQDAYRWRYTGQRYKNGRMRVPLRDASARFHKFTGADVGLLALTGFSHDIGKTVCYLRSGDPAGKWKTVPVREAVPNHDTEGARLLRRLPEVMSLPYRDRRALLLACGFYHHPAGITVDGSVDDRMRSLVELLAASDVATGKAEGDASAATSLAANEINEEDDAWTSGDGESRTEVNLTVDRGSLPREMQILYNIIEQNGAIGAGIDRAGNRVGYKYDGKLWLSDQRVRGRVAGNGGSDLDVANTLDRNGNASIFTTKLLTQLADRHLLLTRVNGVEFKPSRALFKVKTQGMNNPTSGVFVVLGTLLTSIDTQSDDRPIEIIEPLWGWNSGHKIGTASTGSIADASPADRAAGASRPGMGGKGPKGPPAAERQGVGAVDQSVSNLDQAEAAAAPETDPSPDASTQQAGMPAPAALPPADGGTALVDDLELEDPEDAGVSQGGAAGDATPIPGGVASREAWLSFVNDLLAKHPDLELLWVKKNDRYFVVRDPMLKAAIEIELGIVTGAVREWFDYYKQDSDYVLIVPEAAKAEPVAGTA